MAAQSSGRNSRNYKYFNPKDRTWDIDTNISDEIKQFSNVTIQMEYINEYDKERLKDRGSERC